MPLNRSTSRTSANHGMTKCGKCCYYCRQITTFLFSHIGLGTLLLGYALAGALIFQALESENEIQQRLAMLQTRQKMIRNLFNMTNQAPLLHFDLWTKNAHAILNDFELEFLHAVKFKGYDGNDEFEKNTNLQWSFSGALLYSIIVITTIGYGNIAPRTDWGKIVTILYAVIGIPLMLFCLSNIGHTMANSFKFIYWKCCCYLCVKPKKLQRRQRRRRRLLRQQHQWAMIAHANAIQMQPSLDHNHLYTSAPVTPVMNSFQSFPTDRTPTSPAITSTGNNMKRQNFSLSRSHSARLPNEHRGLPNARTPGMAIICNQYASWSDECIDAIRNTTSIPNSKSKEAEKEDTKPIKLRSPPKRVPSQVRFQTNEPNPKEAKKATPVDTRSSTPPPLPPPPPPPPIESLSANQLQLPQYSAENTPNNGDMSWLMMDPKTTPYQWMLLNKDNDLLSNELNESDDNSGDSDDIQEKNIPITVCLTLVVSYICGGAWFFSVSEEWTFLNASYFCFVTLSTIGFGDLVPGRTVMSTSKDGQMTLAICALYLLFGMALLAMSLNLVKEKVIETVRIIGERIGILVNDDDDFY